MKAVIAALVAAVVTAGCAPKTQLQAPNGANEATPAVTATATAPSDSLDEDEYDEYESPDLYPLEDEDEYDDSWTD